MTTLMFLKLSTTLCALVAGSSTNPVKLSVILIVLSALMFFGLSMELGTVWFSMIFFLIFMGGILMMFMILSSTLPNEKSSKMSLKSTSVLVVAALGSLTFLKGGSIWCFFKNSKMMVASNQTILIMTLLMMMYLFVSIYMVSKEELPMRTLTLCFREQIL